MSRKGVDRVVRDAFKAWQDSDVETAFIELTDVDGSARPPVATFTVGEEEDPWRVALPAQFPKIGRSDAFAVSSDAEQLEDWVEYVFRFALSFFFFFYLPLSPLFFPRWVSLPW
jgi:hypothetical protein